MTLTVARSASLASSPVASTLPPLSLPTLFEGTEKLPTLPLLTIRQKGEEGMRAYVTTYVVGTKHELMTDGVARVPLYYLSVIGMRGQSTTLRGLFASLAAQRLCEGSLDGVGVVALAHHQQEFASHGRLHWQFEQVALPAGAGLHALLEAPLLTCYDPLQGQTVRQTRSRHARLPERHGTGKEAGSGRRQGKHSKEKSHALFTAKSAKVGVEEQSHQHEQPCFLLLVPGAKAHDDLFLHRLHFAFLDRRVPWPLHPQWASYLWQRAIRTGESEPLRVWGYVPPASPPDTTLFSPPLMAAYLCRPQLAALAADLSRSLAHGTLSRLE